MLLAVTPLEHKQSVKRCRDDRKCPIPVLCKEEVEEKERAWNQTMINFGPFLLGAKSVRECHFELIRDMFDVFPLETKYVKTAIGWGKSVNSSNF